MLILEDVRRLDGKRMLTITIEDTRLIRLIDMVEDGARRRAGVKDVPFADVVEAVYMAERLAELSVQAGEPRKNS